LNFTDVPLKDLLVNKDNDRHGHTESEEMAIGWLFDNHGEKMVHLAEDIALQGRIFDAPLVKSNDGKFVVYDGNRRVTCLKALAGMSFPPDKFSKKFADLKQKTTFTEDTLVSCQIETDQTEIDQALSRRHNGTDSGRGQLSWDPRAKANHANRTGGTNQYPIAEAIESFLEEQGYPNAKKIGRSTLFRLINAKKRQQQFGIFLNEDNSLGLTRPKEEVLHLLSKIANDILDKNLTLSNLLRVEHVEEYLKTLEPYGLEDPKPIKPPVPKQSEKKSGGKSRPKNRDTLIPNFVDYEIEWRPNQGKIHRLWQELQFNLTFSRHELAIPVVFRTLIDLTTRRYMDKEKLSDKKALSRNVQATVASLQNLGLISSSEAKDIVRISGDNKSGRDLESLHRVVHSNSFSQSKSDLIALWDGYEKYLIETIQH